MGFQVLRKLSGSVSTHFCYLPNGKRKAASRFYIASLLQSTVPEKKSLTSDDKEDELVITGISGRFPQSENMAELRDNLYSKRDMVTTQNRFKYFGIPDRLGAMKNPEKFDAKFFGIIPTVANFMDPQQRKILEVIFEAIVDSGLNPNTLRGSSTGVFVGTSGADLFDYWFPRADSTAMDGYGVTCTPLALSNRASYLLDFIGPSITVCTGCSSSLVALEAAVQSIKTGACNAAIVGGTSFQGSSWATVDLSQLGPVSKEAVCRTFDEKAVGFARSEAICTIFVQKRKDARRVYAAIEHVLSNADGYKATGFTFPSALSQEKLLRKVYSESTVKPSEVQYVECHGTGVPGGDTEEVLAVHSVFCESGARKSPLLIGSVKSNMGHGESAAGMCGIAKAIISIQEGKIPPNLHFRNPRKELAHLFDARNLQVVTEEAVLDDGFIGISSFGIGGTNAHLILRAEVSSFRKAEEITSIPTLLPFCGRTEESVRDSLEKASELAANREFVALMQNVFKSNVSGYNVRGCAIIELNKSSTPDIKIKTLSNIDKRLLCFVFRQSQNLAVEVHKDIEKLELFRTSLVKSTEILKRQENSGHIVCGYADGCFSLQEALDIATTTGPQFHDSVINGELSYDILTFLPKSTRKHQSKRWLSRRDTSLLNEKQDKNNVAADSSKKCLDYVKHLPKQSIILELSTNMCLSKGLFPETDYLVLPVSAENGNNNIFQSLQELYTLGINLDFSLLYPTVSFPVPAVTPSLSQLIQWNHEDNWTVPVVPNYVKAASSGMTFTINLSSREHQFLKGHRVNDQMVYPAAGYMFLAWQGLACNLGIDFRELPVVIRDMSFTRATLLYEDKPTEFRFLMLNDRGSFEIQNHGVAVAVGNIETSEITNHSHTPCWPMLKGQEKGTLIESMSNSDVYKELGVRGYQFLGDFRSILSIDLNLTTAKINWSSNWITLLDSLLQARILSLMKDDRTMVVPTRVQIATINPNKFLSCLHSNLKRENLSWPAVTAKVSEDCNRVSCPGIELAGVVTNVIPRRQVGTCIVQQQTFMPYVNEKKLKCTDNSFTNIETRLECIFPIVDLFLESLRGRKPKIVEVLENANVSITRQIQQIISTKPAYLAKYALLTVKSQASNVQEKFGASQSAGLSTAEIVVIDESEANILSDLVVLSQSTFVNLREHLNPIFRDNMFILILSTSDEPQMIQDFVTIATANHEQWKLQLLRRKFVPDHGKIRKISIDGPPCDWIPDLKVFMKDAAHNTDPQFRIYLTSHNDAHSGIVGLVNCLRFESGGDKLRCIFDPQGHLNLDFDNPNSDLMDLLEKDLLFNVIHNATIGSFRYFPYWNDKTLPKKYHKQAYAGALNPGDTSSVEWIGLPIKTQFDRYDRPKFALTYKGEPHEQCSVNYAALNFRDIMCSSGRLPLQGGDPFVSYSTIGNEFSGRDTNNNRVMGIAAGRAITTSVIAYPSLLWPIPDGWTLEEAATVPIAYFTSYHALFYRGRVQEGQSILIHSASGALGQAALTLASHAGMDVYVTVGSDEKRRFVQELFPSLQEDHIFSSRTREFADKILSSTRGTGVDVVLNSLTDDKFHASISCVAENGKFLELGKFEIYQNKPLGLSCFLKNIEFHGIDPRSSFQDKAALSYLSSLLQEGLASGIVKPLSRQVFECNDLENAFEYISNGKHIGKVLIKMQDEMIPIATKIAAVPRTYFSPDKVYVITGGLGGLGLEVANFLVTRGCRYIALTSRSGIRTGYQAMYLKNWKEQGVTVFTTVADLSNYEIAKKFLSELTETRNVGGIFNSCLVLRDALIENQTAEMFKAVSMPKIQMTKNLDELSREFCPDLEYFVVFSSGAAGRGNLGQSSYGMANSAMERICEQRNVGGFHALAIQWGLIGGVGAVDDQQTANMRANYNESEGTVGTVPQTIFSVLEVLELALNQDFPVLSSLVLPVESTTTTRKSFGILETISNIFGINDLQKISPETKLSNLGIDSLSCVHIKQVLERDYQLPMTTSNIRNLSFEELFAIDVGPFRRKS